MRSRRQFTNASLLSLLLCVATGGLWVRSYFVVDVIRVGSKLNGGGDFFVDVLGLQSEAGELDAFYKGLAWSMSEGYLTYPHQPSLPLSRRFSGRGWGLLGFFFGYNTNEIHVTIPLWFPVLVFAALPMVWVRSARQQRRRRSAGLCPACAYNLTGNTSGVCPECGTAVGVH